MKIYNEGTEYASTVYEFSDLIGKTIKKITVSADEDQITFETDDGVFAMYHVQDCCENVRVESITGDLDDLINTPILVAEERSDTDDPPDIKLLKEGKTSEWEAESQTWTFYTLRTIKGSVDLRWYGSSNGYYSERVEFSRV